MQRTKSRDNDSIDLFPSISAVDESLQRRTSEGKETQHDFYALERMLPMADGSASGFLIKIVSILDHR